MPGIRPGMTVELLYANERSISDLPPDFVACPTHLPINIGTNCVQ